MWGFDLAPFCVGLVCNADGTGGRSDVGVHSFGGWTSFVEFEGGRGLGAKKESVKSLSPSAIGRYCHGIEIDLPLAEVMENFITGEGV